MQVTQTHSDGLRHEFKIVVPASDLEARLDNRVSEIKDTRAPERFSARQGAAGPS